MFVEHIYNTYTILRDDNLIRDTILETTDVQNTLRDWEDEVLQLDGVGPALYGVQDMSRNVARVVNALEELLFLATAGYSDLVKAYEDRELLFCTW